MPRAARNIAGRVETTVPAPRHMYIHGHLPPACWLGFSGGKSFGLVPPLRTDLPPEIRRLSLLRKGRIVADGPKGAVLTEENLHQTYGTEIKIAKVDGYYLAYPPTSS